MAGIEEQARIRPGESGCEIPYLSIKRDLAEIEPIDELPRCASKR